MRTPGQSLVVDANVLIDYLASDVTVLQLVSRHIGTVHIPRLLLQEVPRIDPDQCGRLGLEIVDETLEQVLEAGERRGRLSFYDRLCLILARDAGWACVTNDRALRNSCEELAIPAFWGLELMIRLAAERHLTIEAAINIATAIQKSNPRHISEEILERFSLRLSALD
jgi:predicted nucleic acid-binding protein